MCAAAGALFIASQAGAQEKVSFPSTDGDLKGGTPTTITGYLYKPAGAVPLQPSLVCLAVWAWWTKKAEFIRCMDNGVRYFPELAIWFFWSIRSGLADTPVQTILVFPFCQIEKCHGTHLAQ